MSADIHGGNRQLEPNLFPTVIACGKDFVKKNGDVMRLRMIFSVRDDVNASCGRFLAGLDFRHRSVLFGCLPFTFVCEMLAWVSKRLDRVKVLFAEHGIDRLHQVSRESPLERVIAPGQRARASAIFV